jgi:hypothetical protein
MAIQLGYSHLVLMRDCQFFLRGSSITLTKSLPGVHKKTIGAIAKVGPSLRELVLDGFSTFPDALFASVISNLPSLRVLVLR